MSSVQPTPPSTTSSRPSTPSTPTATSQTSASTLSPTPTTTTGECFVSALFNGVYSVEASTSSGTSSSCNVEELSYGLGKTTSNVPFLFCCLDSNQPNYFELFGTETNDIEEDARRRESMKELIDDFINENIAKEDKYCCKFDNNQFHSESMVIAHIRQAHRSKIEEMLHVLAAEDMEQVQMGHFFTKLFYSDFLYPPTAHSLGKTKVSSATEFPSVLAPDLEEIHKKQNGPKTKKKRKDNKDAKKETLDMTHSMRKERKIIGAKNLFSDDEVRLQCACVDASELAEIERKIFGDYHKVKSTQKPQPKIEAIEDESELVEETFAPAKELDVKQKKNALNKEVPQEVQVQETEDVSVAKSDKEQREDKKGEPLKIGMTHVDLAFNLQDRKLRKQVEDYLVSDILDDVLAGLCNKLATRAIQEAKKKEAKDKEEAEIQAKAKEEAEREQNLAAEKEKKLQERKVRRELRKLETEKISDEVVELLIDLECDSLARELFQEVIKERDEVVANAPKVPNNAPPQTPSTSVPPYQPPRVPYQPQSQPQPQAAPILPPQPAPSRTPPLASPFPNPHYFHPKPMYPHYVPVQPMVYRPAIAVPFVVSPTPMMSSYPVPANVAQYDTYNYPEFNHAPLNGNVEDVKEHKFPSNPYTNTFTSYMAKAEPKVESQPQLMTPKQPSTITPKIAVSPVPAETSTNVAMTAISPSKNLRSIPEDYAFDSSRSVVCSNLPSTAKKGEIAAFFKDSTISLGSDYSSKVQFLKGLDQGFCFIQFETQADVDRALQKSGQKLGDSIVSVERPPGVQTCIFTQYSPMPLTCAAESGQRFAFNATIRNAASTSAESLRNLPVTAAPHSLSSLLHTEQDTIVAPSRNKKSSFSPVGNKPIAPLPQETISAAFNQSLFGTNIPIDNILHSEKPSNYDLFSYKSFHNEDLEDEDMQFKFDIVVDDDDGEDQSRQSRVEAEEAFMDRFG